MSAGEVPVVWAPVEGPHTVGLSFRVGIADEPLPVRGVTHLIEHLALSGLDVDFPFNGATGPDITTFTARGSETEMRHFVASVTSALAGLPADRVATEARVLEAEAQQRGRSTTALSAQILLGNRRHGLLDAPELGLVTPDARRLAWWAGHWFNRANLVCWSTGPTPFAFELDALPAGTRAPLRSVRPELDEGRHVFHERVDGLSVAAIVPDAGAVGVTAAVLQRRLFEELRERRGLVYGVHVRPMRLDLDRAMLQITSDAADAQLDDVAEGIQVELARVIHKGVAEDELDRYVEQLGRHLADPMQRVGVVVDAADRELLGKPRRRFDEIVARARAIGVDEVTAMVDRFRENQLLLTAGGIRDRRFMPVPDPLADIGPVQDFPHSLDPSRVVQLGTAGLGVRTDRSELRAPFADVVGMATHPDGQRIVWFGEGTVLCVHADDHADGWDLVNGIDRSVPEELVVHHTDPARTAPPPPLVGTGS